MKIAEYYVRWVGRYPIAKNDKTFRKDRETIEQLESNLPLCDFDTWFQAIYEKICQKLSDKVTTPTVNRALAQDKREQNIWKDCKNYRRREMTNKYIPSHLSSSFFDISSSFSSIFNSVKSC